MSEENGALLFEKKKKKKKVAEDQPENEEEPTQLEEENNGETEVKKKKKKKKVTEETEGDAEVAEVAEAVEELNLEVKKKKKKKVIEEENNNNEEENIDQQNDELVEKKKKKKKKEKKEEDEEDEENQNNDNNLPESESWIGSERDYTYEELTRRIYRVLELHNPEFGDKKSIRMTQPDVKLHGAKKTLFCNFVDICKSMHRSTEHFLAFLLAELGTSGNLDGKQQLILKGRFQSKSVENIMKRYMTEYVICQGCKGSESTLTKDNRLYFVQCDTCGARRSVAAISKGFQAQIGRRKDNKAK